MRTIVLLALFLAGCQDERTSVPTIPTADSGKAILTPVSVPPGQSKDSVFTAAHHARVTSPKTAELVRNVLTNELFKAELQLIPGKDRSFMFDEIDLNNDHKKEIFVGLRGSYFCGTGGCTAFILSSRGKVITRFTVTEFPIIVRPSRTLGWRDLVIGSAAPRPSMHMVKWNGKKYPGNPAVLPAFREVPSEQSDHVLSCNFHAEHWINF